jgi:hypothetical protein
MLKYKPSIKAGEPKTVGPASKSEAKLYNRIFAKQPKRYPKGLPISGLEAAGSQENVTIFHAGTRVGEDGSTIETAGGRVLNVSNFDVHVGLFLCLVPIVGCANACARACTVCGPARVWAIVLADGVVFALSCSSVLSMVARRTDPIGVVRNTKPDADSPTVAIAMVGLVGGGLRCNAARGC